MQSITFLIKPASSLCDMRCHYCFYHDISDAREVKNMGCMEDETAHILIQKAFHAVQPGGFIQFLFQGGEPTLAGLDFFRRFLQLKEEYSPGNVQVGYSLQTNGLHLDEKWASFFQQHHFLVGLSMDGNQRIHDSGRLDASGRGTWERVKEALALMDQFNVETNLLCVVSATIAKNPEKAYRSLRSLGNHPLQFIPCLDPIDAERGKEPYSLKPDAYGHFLCSLFDCWYRDWKSGDYVSIRTFEDYLRILMHLSPSTCAASGSCGSYLVVEGDGTIYPCDFYVLDQWKIGNIREMTVEEALSSPISRRFLEEGSRRPEACRSCCYFPLCRGGCKRDWTDTQVNYYCSAFKSFFDYSLPRLQEMSCHLNR
ncbi:MAG: anaerobic sulfatase maturase [Lachnospiraceae bacterium]|nr:anaerobic sulfatase maturase [Lachnospiraceae bacterium]